MCRPVTIGSDACLVAMLLLLAALSQVHAEVVMVYSVSRHGARNVLPKSANLSESASYGGPTLLPEGQRQCYDAGASYAKRYLDPNNCSANIPSTCIPGAGLGYGLYGASGVAFNNYNLLVRSSALDRTIMSARCFLQGVFPPLASRATDTAYLPNGDEVIPVYTMNPDKDDWLIRSYTKCPAYDQRLSEWFASDEFKSKEQESQAVRDAVKDAAPYLNTSLTNWWNVYDAFNVYRTYGVGDPTPNISTALYANMTALAYWLETSKMRPQLTGNLLGGPLLGDLYAKMAAAVNATLSRSQVLYRIIAISSHYNVQLGLLSALNASAYPPAASFPWWTSLPKTASVLAFELHAAPGASAPQALAVRAVVQDGPSASYRVLPLPCSQEGGAAEAIAGPGSCGVEAFFQLVATAKMDGPSQWCSACHNSDVVSCQALTAQQLTDGATTSSGAASDDDANDGGGDDCAWQIAVSVVVTFLGTALIGIGGTMLVMRGRSHGEHKDSRFHAMTG